jgi:hypothetical protein
VGRRPRLRDETGIAPRARLQMGESFFLARAFPSLVLYPDKYFLGILCFDFLINLHLML